jgi:hypothetical protein
VGGVVDALKSAGKFNNTDNKAKDPTYASGATTLRGLHDQLKSWFGDGCWVP